MHAGDAEALEMAVLEGALVRVRLERGRALGLWGGGEDKALTPVMEGEVGFPLGVADEGGVAEGGFQLGLGLQEVVAVALIHAAQAGGFGLPSGEVADEMNDESAAGDLVVEGLQQVGGALHEVFLDDDFVVRGQLIKGGLQDEAVGVEGAGVVRRATMEFVADGGEEDGARGRHGGGELADSTASAGI